ncbi:metallophosphoesterase [Jiangella ureilytica]|uniref:metallophosphoesterase n=1 Tax=Jiangella ureilytica TaxID=2530374 RepID=UPI00193CB25C|nr:metallophosphoesterase [Jiangella ureilytica]
MRRTTVLTTAAAALALTAVAPAATADQASGQAGTVPVQLLSITDLHGYVGDYTASIRGAHAGDPAQTVGGGAYLATHLKRLAGGQPNSILFSAGDDFSGWPDETEFFWNEPTIEYLDAIGLEFSTVGNHEMDRGFAFLDHMRNGTCEGRPDDDL